MNIALGPIILIPLIALAGIAAIVGVIYLIVPVFKGIGWLFAHVFKFVFGEIGDVFRFVGTIITTIVLVPMTVGSVIIGRWSAAAHYGRAIQSEFKTAGGCIYRVVIGHPARLLCLHSLTEGLEKRVPEVVAASPGADRPAGRAGQFEGYTIVGSLPGGGSGGKLFIAEPSTVKLAALSRAGHADLSRVVIKTFSLRDGSSLPQIVRENRALDAAKRLGLILEHELTNDRFYYVMRYVPGDSLGLATQRLHAAAGPDGLTGRHLTESLEYGCDLLRTLCHYHSGGLWHKDVKPDNIIVAGGQAHLVDFGLVTPLRSSMTLTTHGTEYFRDPEMVRMALKGVKVHEVDGAKFDVYAAGAVLYSMIENSFPAHGGLSQITRRCPEAIRWIVRRAMTDYDKRYESAAVMLADLETVLAMQDPFAATPGMLPSVKGGDVPVLPTPAFEPVFPPPRAGSPVPPQAPAGVPFAGAPAVFAAAAAPAAAAFAAIPSSSRMKPILRVVDWWRGRYVTDGAEAFNAIPLQAANAAQDAARRGMEGLNPAFGGNGGAPEANIPRTPSGSARDQVERARARAAAAQARIRARMQRSPSNFGPGLNVGIGVAVVAFMLAFAAVVGLFFAFQSRSKLNSAWDLDTSHSDFDSRIVRFSRTPEGRITATGPGGTAMVAVYSETFHGRTLDECALERDYTEDFNRIRRTDHTVLLLRSGLTPDDSQRAGAIEQQLKAVGFDVIGDVTDADVAGSPKSIDLTSDLRKTLGTLIFGSRDSLNVIRTWMAGNRDLAMVIWIGADAGGDDEIHIVPKDGLDVNSIDAAAAATRVLVDSAK